MDLLERRLRAGLADLERDGLLRTLRPPRGIDFSSNDYLGLAAHPLLKGRMAAAVRELGCGSTGSRLLRGERDCFTALERRFAQFKGTERALYFSSGYLANLAVLTTFPEAADTIFSDQLNHASLIDGVRLSRARSVVFPHLRPDSLSEHAFLATESVFSMDGDLAPLENYAAQCRSKHSALIVDEAHAVGIYGARGSGLIEESGIGGDVFVSTNPAGKALGVAGAFVAGPEWAMEYLAQRARPFIFSTAPPPSIAAALQASLDLIEGEPERRVSLRSRARYLRERLAACGFAVPAGDSPIIPVILGEGENDRAVAVAAAMQQEGFDVRAIRPPTVPRGTARLRISVNVNLSEEVLARFAATLATVSKSGY
ncbi:MAG: aminotransferase class I/II-fold pyridoxal phosphate-dependent enzyme [Bryobacteraceae bacterium]